MIKNAAKEELTNKVAESPLIDLIVNEVLNMDRNSFVHIQQIPQDNCKRIVVIGSDFFQIKWTTYHNESYVDPYRPIY